MKNSQQFQTFQVALITGASSGIGEACAFRFAEKGINLVLCARRKEKLLELQKQLESTYGIEVYVLQLDVRQSTDIATKLQQLPEKFQNIDILVNNAGLALGLATFQEGNIEDWDVMIDTNIKGLLYMTRNIISGMIARNKGHIVNIGSIAGHSGYPLGNVYCATKHAVRALTQCFRMDLLGTPIRVSSIDPGMVKTEFSVVRFKGDQDRAEQFYEGMEVLMANDIADAVIYVTSCPHHVNVSELVIMPTDQASIQLVHRKTRR